MRNLFRCCKQWRHGPKNHLQQNGVSNDFLLAQEFRTLSPSDFGFHNVLREADGKVVFLDFEYFGWDDPVKLVSDFLWHPAMNIAEDLKVRFVQRMNVVFGNDPCFQARLKAVFPLFGLKWCLILLNEFIPTESERRDFSRSPIRNKTTVRLEQLAKARSLSRKIRQMYKDFPYGS